MHTKELLDVPDLSIHVMTLVRIVAEVSFLPHPNVVRCMEGAVFPSIRERENKFSTREINGQAIFLDDNTTPRWAFLWSHGIIRSSHPQNKWVFAHVWPTPKDYNSYTNIANIFMVPECLAGLTDKSGPLTSYIRYHSYHTYGWKPDRIEAPQKPDGYDGISWNYMNDCPDPKGSIDEALFSINNNRTRILRELIKKL